MTSRSEGTTDLIEKRLRVDLDCSSVLPYHVEFKVNRHPLKMDVDTGAAMSIAPESVGDLQSSTDLEPANVVLCTYKTGEQIPVRGVLPVSVMYGGNWSKAGIEDRVKV